MDRGKKTLIHLILGIIGIAVVASIIGALICDNPLQYIYGELLGTAVACGLAFHMYHTLDEELDMEEKHAVGRARLAILFRSLIMLAALIAGAYFHEYIHPVGVFFGLMGLKFSAYIQSIINAIQERGG